MAHAGVLQQIIAGQASNVSALFYLASRGIT